MTVVEDRVGTQRYRQRSRWLFCVEAWPNYPNIGGSGTDVQPHSTKSNALTDCGYRLGIETSLVSDGSAQSVSPDRSAGRACGRGEAMGLSFASSVGPLATANPNRLENLWRGRGSVRHSSAKPSAKPMRSQFEAAYPQIGLTRSISSNEVEHPCLSRYIG